MLWFIVASRITVSAVLGYHHFTYVYCVCSLEFNKLSFVVLNNLVYNLHTFAVQTPFCDYSHNICA